MLEIIKQVLIPQLALFELGELHHIEKISHGLSQQCFYVTLEKEGEFTRYVAKVYADKSAESSREFLTYKTLEKLTRKQKVQGPTYAQRNEFDVIQTELLFSTTDLVAHSSHLLLLKELSGELVKSDAFLKEDKITFALKAMLAFHQLPIADFSFTKPLNFTAIFDDLFKCVALQPEIELTIKAKIASLLLALTQMLNEQQSKQVLCHGDVNFANVIVYSEHNNVKRISLIDFESVCVMPAEYDIGMMLAVNELHNELPDSVLGNVNKGEGDYLIRPFNNNSYNQILSTYQSEHSEIVLNIELVALYYQLSSFINGLWYLGRSQAITSPEKHSIASLYLHKARKQLSQVHIFI